MNLSAKPLFISLMFCLDTEQGHLYTYNKTFGEIINQMDWEHRAAVRAAAQIRSAPENWDFCLGVKQTFFEQGKLSKVEKMVRLIISLATYLNEATKEDNRKIILFVEWFNFVHLVALCVALLGVRKRSSLSLWIMYRLAFQTPKHVQRYKNIHAIFKRLLGNKQMVLLSDSDLVAQSIQSVFDQKVYVLPIPHALPSIEQDLASNHNLIESSQLDLLLCWWPGMPAGDKGLSTIQQIATITDESASKIGIVAAKESKLQQVEAGCQIILLPNALTTQDYWAMMRLANIILLPYNPSAYAERTSGIFTEAISAGKLPLITNGTWMAYEAKKFGLQQLIFDWNCPTITQKLLSIHQDVEIKRKLKDMQLAYHQFHSRQGFSEAIRSIYQSTTGST